MTKETIKKETTEIIKRIEALEGMMEDRYGEESFSHTICEMIKEYKDRYEYLTSSKEYMVHFKGGGWNTCYGVNAEEAFDNAEKEFNSVGCEHTGVAKVTLSSPEGIAAAMRLFY